MTTTTETDRSVCESNRTAQSQTDHSTKEQQSESGFPSAGIPTPARSDGDGAGLVRGRAVTPLTGRGCYVLTAPRTQGTHESSSESSHCPLSPNQDTGSTSLCTTATSECAASADVRQPLKPGENETEFDAVDRPAHYQTATGLQAVEVIEAFRLSYHLGNAVKYILRAGKKDDARQDIRKAIWYLRRAIGEQEL